MFIQTQRLDYADHREEIASLNHVLAQIQAGGTQPELKPAIDSILARLERLQIASLATLSIYNQFEDHR
jgi:hypothetical protein